MTYFVGVVQQQLPPFSRIHISHIIIILWQGRREKKLPSKLAFVEARSLGRDVSTIKINKHHLKGGASFNFLACQISAAVFARLLPRTLVGEGFEGGATFVTCVEALARYETAAQH